jgi:hypothetical protein
MQRSHPIGYIDTTARLAVCVDLKFKAGAAEEPNGRSHRIELPSTLKMRK